MALLISTIDFILELIYLPSFSELNLHIGIIVVSRLDLTLYKYLGYKWLVFRKKKWVRASSVKFRYHHQFLVLDRIKS